MFLIMVLRRVVVKTEIEFVGGISPSVPVCFATDAAETSVWNRLVVALLRVID